MQRWALLFLASLAAGAEVPARLLDQAQSDLAAGKYAASIQAGAQAASLYHAAGDQNGEGRALTTTGLAELYSGSYPAALARFTEALTIARQMHDPDNEVVRLSNIGNVYYFQGRYADALDRYQEAMLRVESFPNEKWTAGRRQLVVANLAVLYHTLGQYDRALRFYSKLLNAPQALPLSEQAQLLSNMGALLRRLGDPQKALATYRQAQALYEKDAHRDGEIAVLNNIGILQAMELSDYAAAAATFTKALGLAEQSGDRPLAIHARLYRGETLYRAGRLDESAADFQTAADDAGKLGEQEESWKALYGLSRVAARKGDAARSHELLVRAIGLIESLRAGLKQSSLRSDFLADKRDVYDQLIQNTENVSEIFRLMEQSRARTLQDRAPGKQAQTLSALAGSLPADTAILEYWVGPTAAVTLWISAQGTGFRRWNLTPDDAKALSDLPAVFSDPTRADWREASRQASQKLLSEIPVLQNTPVHNLIVVPDDAVARLPFEALSLSASELLIDRFSVSYLPSASLLAVKPSRSVRWPWQKTLEAFADPSPGAGNQIVELASSRVWLRLPQAVQEVNGIASVLAGRNAVYTGADARKEWLERASYPPLLHFASHAFADMQDPDRSYILFAPASASQRFDYLFLKEVYSLPLKGVDLVTASACETDAGKVVRGEGVQSFSRAFLAAGAASVVTSLWAVGDRSASGLMVRFYTHLASGESKADALRSAKREMIAAHPAHWAAFILNGGGSSPIPYVISWTMIAAFTLLLLAAAVAIRAQRASLSRQSRRP